MIKINLDIPFNTLKGEQVGDSTLGEVVADSLVSSAQGKALKYFGWAVKLTNKEKLELDDEDFRTFYNFVENNDRMTILAKGPILSILDDAKYASKKEDKK